jgi:hypothetical protein
MLTKTPAGTKNGGANTTVHAGTRGSGEYRCWDCHYGIVTHGIVPVCPMCNGAEWQPVARRPARDSRSYGVDSGEAGVVTSSFSSAVTAARDSLASPNSMLVLGSVNSGLSTPA